MRECAYIRKGKEIRALDPETESKMCKSINAAKRMSHKIQLLADKALGRGTLKVLPFVPKKRKRKAAGQFNVA